VEVLCSLFRETEILRLSSVEADRIMDDLMILAQNTAVKPSSLNLQIAVSRVFSSVLNAISIS